MNPITIATAIETRVKSDVLLWVTADSEWTAALAGGFWYGRAGAVLTYPYVVCSLGCIGDANAFQGMGAIYEAEMTIHDVRSRGTDRIAYLIDRLIGNAMLSSGTRTNPTYGFHNHNLVLPSNTLNETGAAMTWLDSEFSAGDGTEEIIGRLRFGLTTSNIAVNQG